MKYKPVIGLEVHIELGTTTKLFCGCSANYFGEDPNTHTCPVCLGLPGALPFANKQAIDWTIIFGLALKCEIASFSKFDRKNYFYPDLPKGYQISQYDLPFCSKGEFISRGGQKIGIRRIHLEEDTGKLIHTQKDGERVSLIDFNRSSVPLMELVSEPDFDNPELVDEFLREVQLIVRYLGISAADMEKGSMRLEANISLANSKQVEDKTLPDYKVEIKNINSFKFLQKAIKAEIDRQSEQLDKGIKIPQETRGYDEKTGKTVSQRVKEEANDYRYFPEPDLPPIQISDEEVRKLKAKVPELPEQKRSRYTEEFSLPINYIEVLVSDKDKSQYFEKAVSTANKHQISALEVASVIVNQKLDGQYKEPAELVKKLVELTKKEFASASEVKTAVATVIKENADVVASYKSGKTTVLGYLIGQVQKQLKGRGSPKDTTTILLDFLRS